MTRRDRDGTPTRERAAPPRIPAELALLLLSFLLSMILVTGLAGLFALAGIGEPERTARKPLLPLFALIWLLLLRPSKAVLRDWLGYTVPPGGVAPVPAVVQGFLAGAATLAVMQAGMLIAGARVVDLRLEPLEIPYRAFLYLLQALILGLLEESLFRGLLQRRLGIQRPGVSALLAGSLGAALFSAAHFLRPPGDRPPQAWWDTGIACISGLAELGQRWTEALGLFLVGAVLIALRHRSGSIWLPLGVHAGWVWVMKISRKTLDETAELKGSATWLAGTERVYDGIPGWLALLATLLICLWLVRPPDLRLSGAAGLPAANPRENRP